MAAEDKTGKDRWFFIANPVSGSGLGKIILADLRREIQRRGIDAEVHLTEGRGHATALAEEGLAEGFSTLVVLGGDGTVNEALQAIPPGSQTAFGIIPSGTGNDYVEAVGFSRHFGPSDWDLFFERHTALVDTGICNGKRFLNGVGMGFDARVAAEVQNPGLFRGPIRYWFHVLANLLFYRPHVMSVDNGVHIDEKRALLATVGIGRRFGGGFYLTPQALVNDGLFDVCLLHDLNTFGRLGKLLAVVGKKHVGTAGVEYFRSGKIVFRFEGEMDAHIDGEACRASRFEIDIKPASLRMIQGDSAKGYFTQP